MGVIPHSTFALIFFAAYYKPWKISTLNTFSSIIDRLARCHMQYTILTQTYTSVTRR